MDDIYVGRLDSFDILTTVRRAKPRVINSIWSQYDIELFNRIKSCYILVKSEPPQRFVDAIRSQDIDVVAAQIQDILDSDIHMSNRLRGRCADWVRRRVERSAESD